jgi:hypothetical protein
MVSNGEASYALPGVAAARSCSLTPLGSEWVQSRAGIWKEPLTICANPDLVGS